MAIRVIDDTKLQNIAVAIQAKDNGGTMTVDQMPTRIAAISNSAPDPNGALLLLDWEGTLLQSYTRAEALALEALPNATDTDCYSLVDHDLLTFQEWNWSLADIKTWLQSHSQGKLIVGAIYTTTDGQDHDYWGSPRGSGAEKRTIIKYGLGAAYSPNLRTLTYVSTSNDFTSISNGAFDNNYSLKTINLPSEVTSIGINAFSGCLSMATISLPKRITSIGMLAFNACQSLVSINLPDGISSIEASLFKNCSSLTSVGSIPNGVTSIGDNAFNYCVSLTFINIPSSVTSIGSNVFTNCQTLWDILLEGTPSLSSTGSFSGNPSDQRIYVPRANLSWFETATNWSALYSRFVAIEDHLDYLESIGADVSAYRTGG